MKVKHVGLILAALAFAILTVMGANALTPNGVLNYTKDAVFNPAGVVSSPNDSLNLAEPSVIYWAGTTHFWYRTTPNLVMHGTTNDPLNLSPGTNQPTDLPVGYSGPSVIIVNNELNLFSPNTGEIHRFRGTNGVNWVDACGGSPIISGNHMSVIHDNVTGVWEGLVMVTSEAQVYYYNSTDGCAWSNQGVVISGGYGESWMNKYSSNDPRYSDPAHNMTYAVYVGKLSGGHWRVDVLKGNKLTNLSSGLVSTNVFQNPHQSWEDSGGVQDTVSPTIYIPPQGLYAKKFYAYYVGGQVDIGVAFDADDRSFYEVHNVTNTAPYFTGTQSMVPEIDNNITISATAADAEHDSLTFGLTVWHQEPWGNISFYGVDTSATLSGGSDVTAIFDFPTDGKGVWIANVNVTDGFLTTNWGYNLSLIFDSAPVVNTTSLSLLADNVTLSLSANATDIDADNVTYYYTIFYNNTVFSSGAAGNFTSGKNVVLVNVTSNATGTYNASVYAYDGLFNSSAVSSNAVSVTSNGSCTPLWVCAGYAACMPNNIASCNAVNDVHSCGQSFNGSLTDYNRSCVFSCTPSWVCNNFAACDAVTQTQSCTGVSDRNTCGQSFNGSLSLFSTACGGVVPPSPSPIPAPTPKPGTCVVGVDCPSNVVPPGTPPGTVLQVSASNGVGAAGGSQQSQAQKVIVLAADNTTLFTVQTDTGATESAIYMYRGQTRKQTYIIQSYTQTTQILSVACAGSFCPYVSLSKSSVTLAGMSTELVLATVSMPLSAAPNATFEYTITISDESQHSAALVTTVVVSTLADWYSKLALFVQPGDAGFWFALGTVNVPKIVLYVLIVGVVEIIAWLVLPGDKKYRDIVSFAYVALGLLAFVIMPFLY